MFFVKFDKKLYLLNFKLQLCIRMLACVKCYDFVGASVSTKTNNNNVGQIIDLNFTDI